MNEPTQGPREDLFANLLRSVHIQSSVHFRPRFRAPWGVRIAARGVVFHIVIRGRCRVEVKGTGKPLLLSRGDFVVLPRGDVHVVRDAPTTPVVNMLDLAAAHCANERGEFEAGGDGPVTEVACGIMRFVNEAIDPLLAILPPVVHVKGRGGRLPQWLKATLDHVVDELQSNRAGADVIVTRLADVLFIHAVRAHFEQNIDRMQSGWLAAARDRQVGRALALLHAQPEKPWTVASLADQLATSRSVLAAKFTRLVGEPPLRYLTRLRLNAAAARLASTDDKLKSIAEGAGYRSVAAFTKAFGRHLGVTPGQYRLTRRSNHTQ